MLIFNEQILKARVGEKNLSKYKSVLHLQNVSNDTSSILASVTQYDIEAELL